MARAFLPVGHNDPGSPRRNEDKLWVRHGQALTSVGSDFKRLERFSTNKLSNHFNQHNFSIGLPISLGKAHLTAQASRGPE